MSIKPQKIMLIAALLLLTSCVTQPTRIYSTKLIQPGENSAYLALSLDVASEWSIQAMIQNWETKEEFFADFSLPRGVRNQVRILGQVVYDSEASNTPNFQTSVLFLKPGKYHIKNIYATNSEGSYSSLVRNGFIQIENNTITYLGRLRSDIFVLVLPWKVDVKTEDFYQEDMKNLVNNLKPQKLILDVY